MILIENSSSYAIIKLCYCQQIRLNIPGVSKMVGIFETSTKTKQSATEIHPALQHARDNSKFSGRQTFETSYNFQQQMALQAI